MAINIAKVALEEEIDRWIRWHTNKLRSMQQYAIDISNDKDYENIEVLMRYYGGLLIDELELMGHKSAINKIDVNTVNKDSLPPEPVIFSSDALSKPGNYTHSEDNNINNNRKVITLARPDTKEHKNGTKFLLNCK